MSGMPLSGYHRPVQVMTTRKKLSAGTVMPASSPRHEDFKSFAPTANGGCEMALTCLAMKNQVPPTAGADTLAMSSSQEWMDGEIGRSQVAIRESGKIKLMISTRQGCCSHRKTAAEPQEDGYQIPDPTQDLAQDVGNSRKPDPSPRSA